MSVRIGSDGRKRCFEQLEFYACRFVVRGRRLGADAQNDRQADRVSLLALLGLYGIFFLRYSVPDQFTFILPSLVLFSLGMAVGMDVLARKSTAWRNAVVAACLFSMVLMPLTYAVLPSALQALNLTVARERVLPFRDEMRYWIVPWKHTEKSAERFARAALNEAAPDGIIVCDSTSYYPLILMQGRLQGTEGVSIEDYATMVHRYGAEPDALVRLLSERPVFIVSPVLNFISPSIVRDLLSCRGRDRFFTGLL